MPVPDSAASDVPEDFDAAALSVWAGRRPGSSATVAHAMVDRLMNCLRFMVYSSLSDRVQRFYVLGSRLKV